ncbi:MAG: ribosome recycling factor [Candidatus Saganbacteria bacterium]|nr:ribosome recycling factor [Candidatus Saganbacteria bacterium]
MEAIIKSTEEKMQKSIESLKMKFSGVRTGRASPALVENLMVDYYGSPCALKSLANIGIPENRTITIQPYDKSALKDIEKAVQKSSLGINPKNEGGRIILSLPQPTEERRRELTKVVKSSAEEAKVALRNIRRDVMDELKKKKTNKELSEDAEKLQEAEVQKVLKKFTDQIDAATAAKQKEILEV